MVQEVGEWFDDYACLEVETDLERERTGIHSAVAAMERGFQQAGQAVSRFREASNEWGSWDSPIRRYEPGYRIGTTWLTDDRAVQIGTVAPQYQRALENRVLRAIQQQYDVSMHRSSMFEAEYEDGTTINANLSRLAPGYILWPNCTMESMTEAECHYSRGIAHQRGHVERVQREPLSFTLRPTEEELVTRPSFHVCRFDVREYAIPYRQNLMILHGA